MIHNLYLAHRIQQPISKLPITNFITNPIIFDKKPVTNNINATCDCKLYFYWSKNRESSNYCYYQYKKKCTRTFIRQFKVPFWDAVRRKIRKSMGEDGGKKKVYLRKRFCFIFAPSEPHFRRLWDSSGGRTANGAFDGVCSEQMNYHGRRRNPSRLFGKSTSSW